MPGNYLSEYGAPVTKGMRSGRVSLRSFASHVSHSVSSPESDKTHRVGRSLVAQQVGDLALSLQLLGSLLGHRFDPWPRSFCMPWAQPKIKIKIKPTHG